MGWFYRRERKKRLKKKLIETINRETYEEALKFVDLCITRKCDIALIDYYLDYDANELSGMFVAKELRRKGFEGLIFIHSANEGIDLDYSIVNGFITKG